MNTTQIRSILSSVDKKSIAVVGDIMLDIYLWGQASRISPEAPVPVVDIVKEEQKLGGAGNVALGLRALGCNVGLCGVVGNDENGKLVRKFLKESAIREELMEGDGRPTSSKTRVVAARQQVVRIDREKRSPFAIPHLKNTVEKIFATKLDAIVLSDYGKGLLSKDFCQELIQRAVQLKIPVIVDPKGRDYEKYRGATMITPNQDEAGVAVNDIVTDENIRKIAEQIQSRFGIRNIVITRSEKGIFLLNEAKEEFVAPAKVQEVYDVTGAGDTVVVFLAAAISAHVGLSEAIQLANLAAAVSVAHVGVYSVRSEDLVGA
jgi:D-beta-D-heptose 7-phosphate kinase/D-beta-D-heptose 1-phosphate adenosyltransferase